MTSRKRQYLIDILPFRFSWSWHWGHYSSHPVVLHEELHHFLHFYVSWASAHQQINGGAAIKNLASVIGIEKPKNQLLFVNQGALHPRSGIVKKQRGANVEGRIIGITIPWRFAMKE